MGFRVRSPMHRSNNSASQAVRRVVEEETRMKPDFLANRRFKD